MYWSEEVVINAPEAYVFDQGKTRTWLKGSRTRKRKPFFVDPGSNK